jgi:ATP-dependent RNA helicase RhlE
VPETYVHRIGRTGRAGTSGIAYSFCDAEEKAYLNDIQKLIGKKISIIEDHAYPMQNFNPQKPAKQTSNKREERKDNRHKKPFNRQSSTDRKAPRKNFR